MPKSNKDFSFTQKILLSNNWRLLLILLALFFATGCRSFDLLTWGIEGKNINLIDSMGGENIDIAELDKLELKGFRISDYQNPQVRDFINMYSTGAKNSLQNIFNRAAIWLPIIKKIFNEHGVPEELIYLPIIESGFRSDVTSHAGASGMWQFMYATGILYKLQISHWSDDRRDPYKATEAAARHIKYLYKQFQSWPLVLAAYNSGGGKVARGIDKYKTTDFWELSKHNYFKKETKDYVPKFIAAATIAKNPSRYGFIIPNSPYVDIVHVEIDDAADIEVISQSAGISSTQFKTLNPSLKQWATPPGKKYSLNFPSSNAILFKNNFLTIPPEQRITYRQHMVRIGDNIIKIGKKYNVPVNSIVEINKFKSKHSITAGENIYIPIQGLKNAEQIDQQKKSYSPKSKGYTFLHQVRRDESVYSIARRYDVEIEDIFYWNKLKNKFDLRAGDYLVIILDKTVIAN